MRDLLFKLRLLRDFLANALAEWRSEVWAHDLDSPYCCSGNPGPPDFCGCQGMTRRELYTPRRVDGGSDG